MLTAFLLILAPVVFAGIASLPDPSFHVERITLQAVKRTNNGIHIPLIALKSLRTLTKRVDSGSVKLGDYFDLSYTMMVKVGKVEMPLIVDTGNGDLLVLFDDCKECNSTGLALYPKSDFFPTGFSVNAQQYPYSASGPIGIEDVGFAGISISDQYFASIEKTDSTIGVAASGVIGLGFPVNSVVWWESTLQSGIDTDRDTRYNISTFTTFGPLIARMAMAQVVKSPMFTISLQRASIDFTSSSPGIISIGEFPDGVKNDSFLWSRIRLYDQMYTKIPDPQPDDHRVPHEYPIYWEVPLEDVFFDDVKLPWAPYAASEGNLASIESASPLIQGPPEAVQVIRDMLNGDYFDCSTPHNLTFKIGGKLFPVDPRDFIVPVKADSTATCGSTISDDNGISHYGHPLSRYSWILGAPFMKGVLASFYYGNVTHPWLDPPRVGLLSRVPGNANDLLKAAVGKGVFPNTTEELFTGSGDAGSPATFTSTSLSTTISGPTSVPNTGGSTRLNYSWGSWAIPNFVIFFNWVCHAHRCF